MDDRKKRLAALRAKAGRHKAPSSDEAASAPADVDEKADATLQQQLEDSTKVESSKKRTRQPDNDIDNDDDMDKPVKKTKSALEEALEKAKKDLESNGSGTATTGMTDEDKKSAAANTELTAMAPKKINWDLKRDIQPKLDKLEKRTQNAIVQMLKERLAREADSAAAEDEEEGQEDLD